MFALRLALALGASAAFAADGNRLTYLDSDDPFYPHRDLARLTTPQWIGEAGVEAVVILSIDDLRETQKYEDYVRPVLERLKQIDGRAPFSIFCNTFDPADARFQSWLKEGVSLEVHTLAHPCPLLGKMNFDAAWDTVFGGLDLLAKIPGNVPRAFRMPCCDSMNSASPRFFAEILPHRSKDGHFFAMDSSVGCLLTPADKSLPRELVTAADGAERFRKYYPMEMKPPVKLTFERFGGYIEDYPYPYVVARTVWEFPFVVPSDWAAFNAHGAKNPRTTEDWKAALDAIVLKQGVMTLVVHPHGWSDPAQLVALIDHAVAKHGRKVKFLNFAEALARLEKNLLGGESLRTKTGGDNGVRVLDADGDGLMDVVIGNERVKLTRVWSAKERRWDECGTPFLFSATQIHAGVLSGDGAAVMLDPGEGGWRFHGGDWRPWRDTLRRVQNIQGKDGDTTERVPPGANTRLRDFDGDGVCELLVSNPAGTTIYRWSEEKRQWEKADLVWPEGVSLVNERGEDNGLRFVDLNGDGCDDLVFSNEERSGIWLWAKNVNPGLGWKAGWSVVTRASGLRSVDSQAGDPRHIPPLVRAGRNTGAWFKHGRMFVQNEDTAKLGNVVEMRTFQELIAFDTPPPKSPEDSLATIQVREGFTVELVAAEPLVVDPIAFEWDARGRLWVVEMRDYPLGMDGKGKPGGVVKVLTDTDGDGRYDEATPFLEDLPFPTGVMPWRKGALISIAPDLLYAEDTDGDGRAEVRRVLFTGFAPGNQQHRFNGFELGLDGWIYCANGDSGGEVKSLATGKVVNIRGRDIRFRPDTGEVEAIEGQTQFGRRCDDFGNWFGNNNPTWLWHYPIPERAIARNPQLAVQTLKQVLANYAEPTRVFPISTPPIRFNQPHALNHVTSACSAAPYRDELFGPDFATSVFISEPVHNVVHREVLVPEGVTFTSRRAEGEEAREFLASTDNWFRPTMLKTGPDGALYIADMYRFVLEHPQWIAPETQARLDLRAGEDRGRIYRVYPAKTPPRAIPDLTKLDAHGLVAALDSPSGWQRTTAQRLLLERDDPSVADDAARVLRASRNVKARLHSLAVLAGLGELSRTRLEVALRSGVPDVIERALQFLGAETSWDDHTFALLRELAASPAPRVRFQLALALGASMAPEAGAILGDLALRDGGDSFLRTAILSSAAAHGAAILERLLAAGGEPPADLLAGLVRSAGSSGSTRLLDPAATPAVWRYRAVAAMLETPGGKMTASVRSLVESARPVLKVETAQRDPGLVAAALALFGRETDDGAAEIVQLLAPQAPRDVQTAAVAALARMPEGKGDRVLLAGWGSYTPALRVEVVRALLTRAASVQEFIGAIEAGRIASGEIDAATREALLQHRTGAIRSRAAKLFSATRGDRQNLVNEYLAAMPAVGDATKGADLFRQQCALCHRLRGEGAEVGPDLGMVAGKLVEELLTAILDPNRTIEARYLAYTATTKDGRGFAGILASESANAVVMKAAGGAEQTLLRTDLKEIISTGCSLMPEGLEHALTKAQMADLLRWLRGP
jgi:putative membrane-bound dehydrogenase-like protein